MKFFLTIGIQLLLCVVAIGDTVPSTLAAHTKRMQAFLSHSQSATFSSFDGTTLSYTAFRDPNQQSNLQRTLVILPGKGESRYRWAEVAKQALILGYGPVYFLEHRGQGFSPRLSHKNKDVEYVADFNQYVQDFIYFMDHPVKNDLEAAGLADQPIYLVSHSMGGAVANLALLDRPDLISTSPVYISPMFGINGHSHLHNALRVKSAKILAEFLCLIGCDEISMGLKTEEGEVKTKHFRRKYALNMEKSSHVYMLGLSPSWLREAIGATELIQQRASEYKTPSLIITARHDEVVLNDTVLQYACQAGACTVVEIPGQHSLQLQSDKTFGLLMSTIHEHFNSSSVNSGIQNCASKVIDLALPKAGNF